MLSAVRVSQRCVDLVGEEGVVPVSGYGHIPDRYERCDRDLAVADQLTAM
jgi:hypothetical protein